MPTVLRIKQGHAVRRDASDDDTLKNYVDRLVKLVPAEVVGIYLSGKSLIQAVYARDTASAATPDARQTLLNAQAPYWIGWTLFCFVALVVIRRWATQSRENDVPPQWPAIGIAAGSFLIWVYNFGDVFALTPGLWQPLLAALLVIAWTFAAPFFYRGDAASATYGANRPAPPPDFGPSRAAPTSSPPGPAPRPRSRSAAKPFTEAEAEDVVMDMTDAPKDPLATVSDRYDTAQGMRRYLGVIQDEVVKRGWNCPHLAAGSDKDVTELSAKRYTGLARWLHLKVTGG